MDYCSFLATPEGEKGLDLRGNQRLHQVAQFVHRGRATRGFGNN